MSRDARQPEGLAPPGPPYSPVVVAGELVYTAGQVAMGADGTIVPGGIEEQTVQVLDNVERCLAAAGCSMDDVVKVTAFLSDLGAFEGFNHVYARRFARPYPARSTVEVGLAPGLLVEIEAVARIPRAAG
jgi:2-iminobutanoate/2-iminopropanoate deaminase